MIAKLEMSQRTIMLKVTVWQGRDTEHRYKTIKVKQTTLCSSADKGHQEPQTKHKLFQNI